MHQTNHCPNACNITVMHCDCANTMIAHVQQVVHDSGACPRRHTCVSRVSNGCSMTLTSAVQRVGHANKTKELRAARGGRNYTIYVFEARLTTSNVWRGHRRRRRCNRHHRRHHCRHHHHPNCSDWRCGCVESQYAQMPDHNSIQCPTPRFGGVIHILCKMPVCTVALRFRWNKSVQPYNKWRLICKQWCRQVCS